ncbi:MAG: hypothetical protein LAN84_15830 [Acidobacteriia bacterium]|nr:hypothetical protein [Terriglobia bacterium]
MRLRTLALAVAIAALCGAAPPRAAAQNPDMLMPEESAAKAQQLLQQMIQALGGPAYQRVRESVCDGRLAQFGRNGDLTGYVNFRDYWRYPDKNRTEYEIKGGRALSMILGDVVPDKTNRVIELYAGNQGWMLDRRGVTEQPADVVTDFQEQTKKDLDNLLRLRRNEEGMSFRFGGSGVVDLKQVDWVEIVDRERRTFRIAVDRESHLPLRTVVVTRNEMTRERTEEITLYSNFHTMDGVETPMQLARERDGRRSFQAFYLDCHYNTGIADELFTRASLEKRYSETASKKDKKKNESEKR